MQDSNFNRSSMYDINNKYTPSSSSSIPTVAIAVKKRLSW
jgi:hypothetical protein